MLSTAHCENRYTKPRIYENEWIDNHSIRIPWLNFLTAQSIPEETDVYDCPKHSRSDSDCSSSSIEDCYIVLEVQKRRLIDETQASIIEENLNFAQINEDEHHVEYEQLVTSMINEVPLEEHAVEHRLEQKFTIAECDRVVQRTNYILFHTSENLDNAILVSSNGSSNIAKLESNDKINEHDSISIPTEQRSVDIQCSITSLDSIENNSSILSTFSQVLTQPTSNSIEAQQEKPIVETTTFARAFTYDHTCKEKYNRVQEQKMYSLETNTNSSILNNLSKIPIFRRLIKNRSRTVKSKYDLANHKSKSDEPSLIQIKYLDGRSTLTDIHARELNTLSNPISSPLNLSKMSIPQDLSYRKRIFNHLQTVFRPKSTEQFRPWQHKTVSERFNERKSEVICH